MRTRIVLVVAALLFFATAARSASLELPLEIATFGADVVAVGEITSDGIAQHIDKFQAPDSARTYPADVIIFEMKVTKLLKDSRADAPGATSQPAASATPGPATAAASQPAATAKLRLLVTKLGEGGLRTKTMLAKGQKLIVAAFRIDGRDELYVPPETGFRLPASEDALKQVAAALDTDKWAWGAASHGLQLAVIAPTDYEASYPPVMVVKGVKGLNIMTRMAVAVRNTSDKPITIPMRQLMASVAISADSGSTKTASTGWYDVTAPPKALVDETAVIPAGAVWLLGAKGRTRFGCNTEILVQYAKVTFRVTASAEATTTQPAATQPDDGPTATQPVVEPTPGPAREPSTHPAVWHGKLESGEVKCEVRRVEQPDYLKGKPQ